MSKFINFILWIIFSILSFGILTHELVEGKTISNAYASIIKTIESDDDEIIDCYDIYRQPALSNPLFRNHPIQMKPSSYPKGLQPMGQENFKISQMWRKFGLCPKGTVPIRRPEKNYHPNPTSSKTNSNTNEYAIVTPVGDNFQRAQATINIWKPLIEQPEECSTSQIWISSGDNKEVIETGWEVNKSLYGDEEPRLFVYWTVDHFNSTGCYNIRCTGFVQTTSKVSLGSSFQNVSIFHGNQYATTFIIFKEKSSGNWWVHVQGVIIGYWPHFLFKATRIDFGGQILNTHPNKRHTSTQMGSGHLPSEGGFGKASHFSRVKVFGANYEVKIPERVLMIKTNPSCYGLKLGQADSSGITFYYGGPGFSSTCP